VRGWNAVNCEVAGDLSEGPAFAVLVLNPFDDLRRDHAMPSGPTPWGELDRGDLRVLLEEPLELANGDQSRPPRRLDCVEGRDDAAVDGRDADAEGVRRLPSRIDERLDTISKAEPLSPCRRAATVLARRITVTSTLKRPTSVSARAHRSRAYTNSDAECTNGASVWRVLSASVVSSLSGRA
jgi:hypothetical protein